jgi:transposase
MRTKPLPETFAYGGKKVFHVVAVNREGAVIQRVKFARETLQSFFDLAPKVLIGMEACPGSQWLARKLIEKGHDARIIPARFVKPYVKSNKTDTVDAAAIAEAVTRPTIRFVEVGTAEQVDLQALHRIRDRLVRERTGLMNQARAFCIEYGLAMRVRAGGFHADIRRHLGNMENDLTQNMRALLNELLDDLAYIENRVKTLSAKIEAIANEDETIRRRLTIPGIGALGATALIVAAGDGRQFRKARDMAAWLGLVPAEHSTGGKRKRICAPSEHPRGTILLSAPEPRKPCFSALAERLGSKDPSQQSRRYFGQQAHPDRLGDPDVVVAQVHGLRIHTGNPVG